MIWWFVGLLDWIWYLLFGVCYGCFVCLLLVYVCLLVCGLLVSFVWLAWVLGVSFCYLVFVWLTCCFDLLFDLTVVSLLVGFAWFVWFLCVVCTCLWLVFISFVCGLLLIWLFWCLLVCYLVIWCLAYYLVFAGFVRFCFTGCVGWFALLVFGLSWFVWLYVCCWIWLWCLCRFDGVVCCWVLILWLFVWFWIMLDCVAYSLFGVWTGWVCLLWFSFDYCGALLGFDCYGLLIVTWIIVCMVDWFAITWLWFVCFGCLFFSCCLLIVLV